MKKLVCLLMMIMMLLPAAFAQEADTFTLWFEDGFAIDLPEGWVCYPIDAAAEEADIRYILGNGEGTRYMYIQYRATTLEDTAQLSAAIEGQSGYEKTGELTFGGQTFLAYGIPAENLSGCMTILNDHLLTFIYSPQSDSEYMLQAAEIMDTFKLY